MVGNTNSNPPGPIIVNGQSRTGSTGRFIFITLFSSRCTALPAFFNSLNKLRKYVGEKLFSCTKSSLFVDFSLSDFTKHWWGLLLFQYRQQVLSVFARFSTPFHSHFAFEIFSILYLGSRKMHVKVQASWRVSCCSKHYSVSHLVTIDSNCQSSVGRQSQQLNIPVIPI